MIGPDLAELDASWREYALCAQADPEAFFPEKGGSVAEAKRVCARCPVQAACLDYALRNNERFGVWGGTSEPERRRMLRRSPNAGRAAAA